MATSSVQYGLLKGTVTGHLRDADDDHYQILVTAKTTMFRIAVNVESSLKPPDLLFQSLTSLPDAMLQQLAAATPGFTKLASKPGGLAVDFIRSGLLNLSKFKVVPGSTPGPDGNDLKDTMEDAAVKAMSEAGSLVYAFGSRFGPENKKDQYFHFLPGNGIHDIHMNQGNDKSHAKDDGVFRDGCLIFVYPDKKVRAFFMAFQSQSFHTDNKTGHAIPGGGAPAAPAKSAPVKKSAKKPAKTKTAAK